MDVEEFRRLISAARKLSDSESENALLFLDEARTICPPDAESHYGLGLAYALAGQNTHSLQEFRNAIALDPTFHRAHAAIAFDDAVRGNHGEALRRFDVAISHGASDGDIIVGRARALERLNRLDEAESSLCEFLRGTDAGSDAVILLIRVLCRRKKYVEAIERAKTLITRKPDCIDAQIYLADAYFELGEIELARKHVMSAAALSPADVWQFESLALLAYALNETDLGRQMEHDLARKRT